MNGFASLAFLVLGLLAPPISGPEVGKELPELKATPVPGDENCKPEIVMKRGEKAPGAVVLVRGGDIDRPAARFLRLLVERCAKDNPAAYVNVAWVTEEMEKTIDRVAVIQGALKHGKLRYSSVAKENESIQPWGLSTKAGYTDVTSKAGKVFLSIG
jgi:hypothetical protein